MRNLFATTNALSDIITGKFNMNSTWMGAELLVNFKESANLIHDVIEPA